MDFARELRAEDPGLGARKIWLMGKTVYGENMIGRDAFYRLLESEGMRLRRPRPRRTTNSNHRYHKYKNLIKNFLPYGPNLLWVCDITYIQLKRGCCYLHLVTDAYSHKVIGWCISETLEAQNTLAALKEAINQAEGADLSQLIHHSDRGVQYCCNAYVDELNKHGVRISMTEDYKPTDNGLAERINGIIKSEKVYRDGFYDNIDQARKEIGRFISFYNDRRIHMSIGYKTPSEVHKQTGPQERMWKANWPTPSVAAATEGVVSTLAERMTTFSGNCQQNQESVNVCRTTDNHLRK